MFQIASLKRYLPFGVWIFFFLVSLRYGVEIWNGGHEWKTGDWLINYSDGFIRRGLFGSLVYTASELGVSLLWLTYAMQISIYALMFAFVIKLYQTSQRSLFWLLILYSPAFLLFPFYDFQGGFRKEILVLTLFAYFSLVYARYSVDNGKMILITFFYLVAALSHEVTIFALPFFLYLLYRSVQTTQLHPKLASTYGFLLLTISVVAIILSFNFKGSECSASVICNSLIERSLDPNICNGAISWLKEDTQSSIQRVIEMFGGHAFSTILITFLAFVPISFTSFWNKKSLILLIVATAFMAPLFLVAIDWGRWIYILAFMFYCLILAEKVSVSLPFRYSFVIVSMIYLTSWSIPHCCVGGGVGTGFVGSVLRFAAKFSSMLL